MPPAKTLDGLTPDDADRHVAGAAHSIAEIVAHLAFWQGWFLERCRGTEAPMVTSAADGWPVVSPGSWPEVRQRFLTGLDALAAIGEDEKRLAAPVTPAIDFEALKDYTIGDVLAHMGQHNAHHLGQVIFLRQLLGRWPPPSGSWTW